MDKLLISLVLLSLSTAVRADYSDVVPSPGLNRDDRTANAWGRSERPVGVGVEDNIKCVDRAGGFPFCATKSVLRWHEAPAHHAPPSLRVDHGRSI